MAEADVITPNLELQREIARLQVTLRPFAYLAEVMEEGQVLNFRGVYVTWEQAQAAKAAVEGGKGEA